LAYTQFERVIKGAGVPDLHLEDIRKVIIPIPTLNIQKQIIDFYFQKYNEKQQKEAEAKALLDSIDDYLLGELGITLPNEDDDESNLLLAAEPKPSYGNSDGFELDKENLLVKKGRLFLTGFREIVGQRIDAFYNKEYFEKVEKAINNGLFPIIKLNECIYFIESGSRPSGGVSHYEEGVLSFGGEHVNNNCELEVKIKKFIPLDFHKSNLKTKTELNDILIVKDGATTGKVAIIENIEQSEQNINEHVFMLKTNVNCNPFYLAYYLHSKAGQIQIQRGITGATVTGITKEIVKNIIIPLPLMSKQIQIAQKIQEIRQKANELQQEATAIIESAKQQVEQMILGS